MTTPSPQPTPERKRLALKTVTLCAVSSSNIEATVAALKASLAQIDFAQALFLTDKIGEAEALGAAPEIKLIAIDAIRSAEAYSHFMLKHLANYISTDHALIVQWDGHVVDAERWQDTFLDYDYIGASWPQFDDGHDVGNGGFSLRSRRLLNACRDAGFKAHHPEDLAIGRTNRLFLEEQDFRFARKDLADQFSAERSSDPANTFGYHGVFLMPQALGHERFWQTYQSLNDRTTLRADFRLITRAVLTGKNGVARTLALLRDALFSRI